MAPRRFSKYIFIGAIFLFGIIIISDTSRPVVESVKDPVGYAESLRETIPSFRFSFQRSAHKPPEQKNSTHGDSSWYSDWKWLNPFSSSITLDEDRMVLPLQLERAPVYVFYDTTLKRDEETKKIDKELLLIWRRSWWAHGFRPVVLTEAESMSHPLYQTLHAKGMPEALEQEFRQWLAWAHMGTGLLARAYCLPMGPYDDPLLSHLRRGQHVQLTKFAGLRSGLFAGEQTQINDAIKSALDNVKLSTFKTITEAISSIISRSNNQPRSHTMTWKQSLPNTKL